MKVNKNLVNLECTDCGKFLLVLQLTSITENKEFKILTRVVVKCICGGFSCVQQILGPFCPGAPNDQMLFDILDDIDGVPEADVFFKAWSK